MNNQNVPRFCIRCGCEAVPGADFCMVCGQKLEKPRSPVGQFFLALAKCLGYYGFFLGTQIVVMFVAIIAISISGIGHYDADGAYQTYLSYIHEIGIISGILTLIGYIVFFKIRKKSFIKEVSLKPLNIASAGAMVFFGLTAQIIISLFLTFFFIFFSDPSVHSNEAVESLFENGSVIMQFLNVAVLTGILEEVLFRGLIYKTLKTAMPTSLAVFLSAVIFGAAHMNLEQFLYTTVLGVLLALVYERKGSLLAPIIIHMTFNGSNFVLSYLNFEHFMPYIALLFLAIGIFLITLGFVFFTDKEPEKSLKIIKE